MASVRPARVHNEIRTLQSSAKFLLDESPLDDQSSASSHIIVGRILPDSDIYNQATFQIEIKLTAQYPFTLPEVRFLTPIYHPNVGEDGKICIAILNVNGTYRPTTPLIDIVLAIIDLIDNPQIDHALNAEIAAEYVSNRAEFNRKALASVQKHGLPRQ